MMKVNANVERLKKMRRTKNRVNVDVNVN